MSSTITEEPRTETLTQSVVTLTESAARHISGMLSDDKENAGKQLRVFVEAGGCSGLQYGMVFDERRDDDLTSEFQGVMVVVDPFSANYIRGAVIDFSEDLSGGGFKINNPNAQSNCGCGKSFHA
jgi:iron-sulfur cluster assembly accessory protein